MKSSAKKLTIVPMLLVLASLCTAAYAAGILVYENAAAGVRMNYPADWEKTENMGNLLVGFTAAKEDANDNFQENLNVAVQTTDETGFTPEDYAGAIAGNLKTQTPDFNLVESVGVTLVNVPAHKIVYTAKNSNQVSLKVMMVLTLKDGKVYIATFAATEEKFAKYLPEAMIVINSLESI